jgi:hypothetical protein
MLGSITSSPLPLLAILGRKGKDNLSAHATDKIRRRKSFNNETVI